MWTLAIGGVSERNGSVRVEPVDRIQVDQVHDRTRQESAKNLQVTRNVCGYKLPYNDQ